MPIATPHIDLLTVLSLVETTLAGIVGVSIEELGSVPDEAGATAKVLRIKDLEFTYPDRRRTSDGDEATFAMNITVRVRADGEGGALADMAKTLNAIKQLFDREDLTDATTTIVLRCNVSGQAIVDVSEAGGDNGAHGALAGSCRLTGYAFRTSTTTLNVPT